ncbi:GNAT family N-acetyltransferase [Microlunatus sp. Gsoil 973]|uniref:GNAT family N-acetyltransferase n=1 Tax=Microlunatus sp. Gsoil 973 TaxID=2672569 RepID=UPI0012B4EF7A|nr:GNAT family N-acetyltransferase [Microlunatus sp. Gsoil 973]QGN34711.1 GNAT family N-acetyltransferase [Microlunatus sp. Gsoil 973]
MINDADRSAVDMLRTEIGVIWGPTRRAPEAPPSVVIGQADDALIIEVRDDLDPVLAERVGLIVAEQGLPAAATAVAALLEETLGPIEATVGPGYDARHPRPQPTPAVGRLIRSDQPDPTVGRLRVPITWEDDEWRDLLAGAYGPWAMIIDEDRVLSICHCARLAPEGVEAGTWTVEDARGLGLAAAATAAWADACRPRGGFVFYSTDADNLHSQRVAARLGLPLIGQLWKFRPATEGNGPLQARLRVLGRTPDTIGP